MEINNNMLLTTVSLREKFLEEFPKKLHNSFVVYVENFNWMSENQALNILWRMVTNPDYARETFLENFPSYKERDKAFLDEKMCAKHSFRQLVFDEVQYQYCLEHEEFPRHLIYIDDADVLQQYEKFVELTGRNQVVCVYVYKILKEAVEKYPEAEIYRTIILISSPAEHYRFGGLKNLGFSDQETRFLMQFSGCIQNLLNLMLKNLKLDD